MEFSFGLLTSNRKFTKSVRRIYDKLKSLDEFVQQAGISNKNYAIILVSFTDESQNYLEELKNEDNVFQICVGLNHDGLSFLPKDDDNLIVEMANQIKRVFSHFPSDSDREELLKCYEKWKLTI